MTHHGCLCMPGYTHLAHTADVITALFIHLLRDDTEWHDHMTRLATTLGPTPETWGGWKHHREDA